MFRKPSNARKLFSNSSETKKREPMPVFQTNNQSVPVIRNDVNAAFTIGLAKKYLRSSGLEK
jgi:hypothetical protein